MEVKPKSKEIKTAHLIAYSSVIIAILYVIHLFVVLDDSVIKQLLSNSGQTTSENAVGTIKNSFQFTTINRYVCSKLRRYLLNSQKYTLFL
jgi:hypothetical protein